MYKVFSRCVVVLVLVLGYGQLIAAAPSGGQVRHASYQWSPLHWAVRYHEAETARTLATRGNLEAQDALGRTPLHIAAMFGLDDMVALLLERGADANARDQWGVTPLYRIELMQRFRGSDLGAIADKLRASGGVKMDMHGLRE